VEVVLLVAPTTSVDCWVPNETDAGTGITVMLLLAEVSPAELKVSVWAPGPVIFKSVKLATPFTAFTVVIPESVPLPLVIEAVTALVAPATVLPLLSRIAITGWVEKTEPLNAPPGWVVTPSAVGGNGVIPMFPDVIAGSVPLVKLSV